MVNTYSKTEYKFNTWYLAKRYDVYFKFDLNLMATLVSKDNATKIVKKQWYAHMIDGLDRVDVEEIPDQAAFEILYGE